jgi:hypothetical protein
VPTEQQIAVYVSQRRLQRGHRSEPYLGYEISIESRFAQPSWEEQVEQLTAELVQDAEFAALGLADFLNSPNGDLIAKGVGMAIPSAYSLEYSIWVQAMQRAAEVQYQQGRKVAGRRALTATGALMFVVGFVLILRSQ